MVKWLGWFLSSMSANLEYDVLYRQRKIQSPGLILQCYYRAMLSPETVSSELSSAIMFYTSKGKFNSLV